ncbi:6-phosphofructokinase [Trifolium repens]|nr:6-phosphofructokinase [Trifolium repens]
MNWSQFVQLPYNHHMSATSKFDLWFCVEKMKLSTKKKNVADSLIILSSVNRDPRIQDLGINKVYIIGGDGTQKVASVIFEVIY